MPDVRLPSAWIVFLMAADSHIQVMGAEAAISAFKSDLQDHEVAEVHQFLREVSSMSNEDCERIIVHPDPAIDENLFRPTPCKAFYEFVLGVFEAQPATSK